MYRTTGAGKEARPPAMMAMATLVQGYLGISDAEMIELTVVDLRVQMVLGCLGAEHPPFSQGGLQTFRERLIAADLDRRVLERTVELATATKAFDPRKLPKTLRVAIDSSPLEGAGRVEDTFNLLAHAARQVVSCAAGLLGWTNEKVCREAGIPLLIASSIKRALDIDWNDAVEKADAMKTVSRQLDSLQAWLERQLPDELAKPPLQEPDQYVFEHGLLNTGRAGAVGASPAGMSPFESGDDARVEPPRLRHRQRCRRAAAELTREHDYRTAIRRPWPSGSRVSAPNRKRRESAGSSTGPGETRSIRCAPRQWQAAARDRRAISVVCQCARSLALQIERRRPAVTRRQILEQFDPGTRGCSKRRDAQPGAEDVVQVLLLDVVVLAFAGDAAARACRDRSAATHRCRRRRSRCDRCRGTEWPSGVAATRGQPLARRETQMISRKWPIRIAEVECADAAGVRVPVGQPLRSGRRVLDADAPAVRA